MAALEVRHSCVFVQEIMKKIKVFVAPQDKYKDKSAFVFLGNVIDRGSRWFM